MSGFKGDYPAKTDWLKRGGEICRRQTKESEKRLRISPKRWTSQSMATLNQVAAEMHGYMVSELLELQNGIKEYSQAACEMLGTP